MWQQASEAKRLGGSDSVLKESLLRQLSHTVKEVQLQHSQTRETFSTQEGVTSLITVLEAVFLHGLKRSLLESALRSVSVTDDTKPAPTFFEVVKSVTHKDTIAHLSRLSRVTTEVGRSRAWVRLALNEGAMPSYLVSVAVDRRIIRHYRPAALLRDRETLDTAARLIEGLMSIPFQIPLNSSLLNTWSTEPLLLSGLWAPAVRASVQMAVDVAGSIEDEETSSVLTASSSVRSLMTLDEAQAIHIILNTPMPTEENELPEEVNEKTKAINDFESEKREVLKQSYSVLFESCSPKVESAFPKYLQQTVEEEAGSDLNTEKLQEHIEDEDKIVLPVERRDKLGEEYISILPAGKDLESECLRKLLADKNTMREEKKVKAKRSIEEAVLRIPHEKGLKVQRYECADCRLAISLNFGPAVFCHVTGEYLCENCHKSDLSVIPARIIFNWDHTKYLTGLRALSYISSINDNPIFDIRVMNPKLYSVVPEMQDILLIRKQLQLLHLYLSTCREKTELPIRSYIYENPHLFSLSDLLAVPSKNLKSDLEKIVTFGRSHVIHCWMCKQKGFFCELCSDTQVIYPFDSGSIYRCNRCKAVYHGKCLETGKNCPKCMRRKQRESSES